MVEKQRIKWVSLKNITVHVPETEMIEELKAALGEAQEQVKELERIVKEKDRMLSTYEHSFNLTKEDVCTLEGKLHDLMEFLKRKNFDFYAYVDYDGD